MPCVHDASQEAGPLPGAWGTALFKNITCTLIQEWEQNETVYQITHVTNIKEYFDILGNLLICFLAKG